MEQTGTFPRGIEIGGQFHREFALAPRLFRHTMELAYDPAVDKTLLADPVYYDAAIIARRLTVPGVAKVTPEMVLNLDGDDGDELATAIMSLDKRRAEFRGAAGSQGSAGVGSGPDQDRLPAG